jgi:hypothetical protein
MQHPIHKHSKGPLVGRAILRSGAPVIPGARLVELEQQCVVQSVGNMDGDHASQYEPFPGDPLRAFAGHGHLKWGDARYQVNPPPK